MNQLIPTNTEHNQLKEYAKFAVASQLFAGIDRPEKAMMIMMTGLELNMGPVWALQNVSVIKNTPSISAQGMLDLVYRNVKGVKINFKQRDAQACIIEASRPEADKMIFSFTMEDAKTAKLTGNPTWAKYPKAMLHARCVSDMCRAMFPDAVSGVKYTPEEMESFSQPEVKEKNVTPSVEPKEPSMALTESTTVDDDTTWEVSSESKGAVVIDEGPIPNVAPTNDSYVIPFGKFKNRGLDTFTDENEIKQLIDYAAWVSGNSKTQGPRHKEFVDKVENTFISSQVSEPPGFDENAEIPW